MRYMLVENSFLNTSNTRLTKTVCIANGCRSRKPKIRQSGMTRASILVPSASFRYKRKAKNFLNCSGDEVAEKGVRVSNTN